MKKVAGTLKLIYSQYRELASFAQFGSDLDADTKMRLEQGARIVEVLKQKQNAPVPVEKQVAILYAVTKGILSKVVTEDVELYEEGLYMAGYGCPWSRSDAGDPGKRKTGKRNRRKTEKHSGSLYRKLFGYKNSKINKKRRRNLWLQI